MQFLLHCHTGSQVLYSRRPSPTIDPVRQLYLPQRRPGFVAYFEPWSLNYWPLTTLAPELGVTETNYVSLSSYMCEKTKEILVLSEERTLRVECESCNDLR